MSASSRARRLAATIAIGLAIASASSSAFAEPTASEKETARSLVASGREKRRAGDERGALDDFQRAHAIMGVPTTALELGKSQEALGQLVEARTTLLEGVRYPVHNGEPEAFKKARREAKQLAESIAPRLATVTIALTGVGEGMKPKVTIDGAPASGSAVNAPLKVNPGKRVIVVKVGDEEKKAELDLAEGGEDRVRFAFSGTPAPRPIALDPQPKPPEPSASRTSPLVYIGIATAGVGVAVGTVTGIMTISAYDSVKGDCPGGKCPPETHADVDRGTTLGTISTISFVVAGVGAALIVVGILMPSKAAVEASHASISAGPGGIAGTF